MATNIRSVVCGAVMLGALAGCGADDSDINGIKPKPGDPGAQCERVNGQRYLSETLQEMGITPTGIALGHWQLSFEDGVLLSLQSDVGMTGTYSCKGGEVLGELNGVELQFKIGAKTIQFNPWAGAEPLRYLLAPAEPADECAQVAGKRFENTESGDFMAFAGEGQRVEFQLGERTGSGHFDCQLGAFNFYHPAEPGAKPEPLALGREGSSLKIGDITLAPAEETVFCTEQYAPVCGVVPGTIQCITTPCPSGLYETFPNRCYAERAGAINLRDGECGPLEGQPDTVPNCAEDDSPVCAVTTSMAPCLTAPCPTPIYQTFDCASAAASAGARTLKEAPCAESREGQPVTEPLEGACPAVFDPVCAVAKAPIACITEPCPTHAYKTYGNACEAGLSLAHVAFPGECGKLEETVTFGEPPVRLSETLPVEGFGEVVEASIADDVLTATISYGACGPVHLELWIMDTFLESDPVQVGTAIVPPAAFLQAAADAPTCPAIMTETYRYDLRPLKARYQAAYQTETGRIQIQQFGLYEF